MAELDDIKKLSAHERIKRLKELKERGRAEIDKAQKMLDESEQEAKIEEELKDMPIPQLKAVDISSLFSEHEKQIYATKRFVSQRQAEEAPQPSLEKTVQEEHPVLTEEQSRAAGVQYGRANDELRNIIENNAQRIYQGIQGLSHAAAGRELSEEERGRLNSYGQLLEQAHEMYIRDDKVRNFMEGASEAMNKTREYMRRLGY